MTINYSSHPGKYLLDEINERGRSQSEFAKIIGVSPVEINYIIKGTRGISTKLSVRIGEAFGTSSILWMKLQHRYDLYVLQNNKDEIEKINNIKTNIKALKNST